MVNLKSGAGKINGWLLLNYKFVFDWVTKAPTIFYLSIVSNEILSTEKIAREEPAKQQEKNEKKTVWKEAQRNTTNIV